MCGGGAYVIKIKICICNIELNNKVLKARRV
jgi:hypothetical protein